MSINKTINAIFEDLMESQHAISDNPGRGYHGTIDPEVHVKKGKDGKKPEGNAHHDKLYAAMHKRVREVTGAHPQVAKHYLDSAHGRHLAAVHNDNAQRKLTDNHITSYIKKDFEKFKQHYKPDLFESEMKDTGEELEEALYVPRNFDKHDTKATPLKKTFIKGVHGSEDEHIKTIKHVAKVDGETAKKIAHHPSYHEHAYNYRHDFKKGGSNGYDNGVKKLAGVHPHYKNKEGAISEEQLDEISPELRQRYIEKAGDDYEEKHQEAHKVEKRGHLVAAAALRYKANQRIAKAGRVRRGEKLGEETIEESMDANKRAALDAAIKHINTIKHVSQEDGHTVIHTHGGHAYKFNKEKHGKDAAVGDVINPQHHSHHVTRPVVGSFDHHKWGSSQRKYRESGRNADGSYWEESQLQEWPSDQARLSVGDKVIVKSPSSPHNNRRGTYGGMERGRHVVKHADGTRSIHGDGALLKESRVRIVKEATKTADKKPITVRTATGKLVTKLITRKRDVVDAGGKDGGNETENH